jgi:hypothetical protein
MNNSLASNATRVPMPYYPTNDEVILHHGSPYYFNAGEIFVLAVIGALTVSIGLQLYAAVVASYQAIAGSNDVLAAWIAFIIVFVVGILLILLLNHSKKHLMRLAHKSKLLHAYIT